MARTLNKVMLLGNLGRDAETKTMESGSTLARITLATTRRWKDGSGEWQEATDWHEAAIWNASENLTRYLVKGKRVYLEGRLHTHEYADQSGGKRYRTGVVAQPGGVILLDGGNGGGGRARNAYEETGEVPF